MTVPFDLLAPDAVAELSRALTAVVGLFVASLAYRGYRRNDAPKMWWLAVGIGSLTAGVYATATIAVWAGAGAGIVLLVRGLVTVAGLCAVLYALFVE
ncbi:MULTISPECIES: hypothetical protein [Haloarcula]|uniref:DUF7521 family protein n=1 Tax=Haloarcula TaxID=2237 RepID=UPI0006792CDC|nr:MULTISPECIES: hypothetical protein [Haloarcula]KAA9405548.1 hypothetical protein Har1131_01515 [Haloarcula sp. CBA1131]KZX50199.1 hypothetical protein AV929_16770 [Haloarcula sp. K1]